MQLHDLLECGMHGSRPGSGTEDFCSFVHELCVNPDRRFCSHTFRVLSHRDKLSIGLGLISRPAKADSLAGPLPGTCPRSLRNRAGLFSSAPGGAGLCALEAPPKKSTAERRGVSQFRCPASGTRAPLRMTGQKGLVRLRRYQSAAAACAN